MANSGFAGKKSYFLFCWENSVDILNFSGNSLSLGDEYRPYLVLNVFLLQIVKLGFKIPRIFSLWDKNFNSKSNF